MKVYNEHNDNKLTQDLLNCLDKFREKRGFDSKSYIEEKVNIINKYFTKNTKYSIIKAYLSLEGA